ncbi:hypothetical protein GGX14DRAFT_391286 [Mycena pura]|uniref:Uncharacterized protein n=1 Tax=Mycena pura TaxID=153505 RepID=A0AAD6VUG9_9AGAR|nr:hypothetical protein GGX14DRAFT_391286 [Mycena pura]
MDSLATPLLSSSTTFTFVYDRPLKCIATRYYTLELEKKSGRRNRGLTLLFAGGIGLSMWNYSFFPSHDQETWQPVIQEIFRLSSLPTSAVHVHSAWVIERPNHGDAALLNAGILKEHYTELFRNWQYATAVKTFLVSELLSPVEKSNIVGIGFSGGGGALCVVHFNTIVLHTKRARVLCHELLNKEGKSAVAIRMLILLESPHVGPEAFSHFKVLYPFLRKANMRRPKHWKSIEDAMSWFSRHPPWNSFHPAILQIISDTYFVPDPSHPGHITTKTTAEQETAAFVDDGNVFQTLPYLRTVLHTLPVHLVLGSMRDFWCDIQV